MNNQLLDASLLFIYISYLF